MPHIWAERARQDSGVQITTSGEGGTYSTPLLDRTDASEVLITTNGADGVRLQPGVAAAGHDARRQWVG